MPPAEFPAREVSSLVQLFQRAHNKVVALQKLDDQIALLVEQHRRLQDEIRLIRDEINGEFDKALRNNDTPGKLVAEREAAAATPPAAAVQVRDQANVRPPAEDNSNLPIPISAA